MDWAEEPRVLAELASAEKLTHPTEDDEKPLEKNLKPREDPPSLCSFKALPPAVYVLKKIMRPLLNYLNLKDVLQCRLVSHDISDAVDQQLENNYEMFSEDHPGSIVPNLPQRSLFYNCRVHTSPAGPHILEGIHLLDTPTLKQFLLKMGNNERNPFIGRCVRFGNYGDRPYTSEYWDTTTTILEKFGGEIWHVELSFHCDGHEPVPDSESCYKLIRQCLTLMPNLKSLGVCFPHAKPRDEGNDKLNEYIKENPIPGLPLLEKIEWNVQNVPVPIQHTILSAYSIQIKALASPIATLLLENDRLQFPNLVELYLKSTSQTNNDCLVNLGFYNLPSLKKLYLDLGGERCTSCRDLSSEAWSVKSVLSLVVHFKLDFLSLFLAPGSVLTGSRTLTIKEWKVDCLKTLEIQHCAETSYEFLKCFTNLEHIHFFDIHHRQRRQGNNTPEEDCADDVHDATKHEGQSGTNEEITTTLVKKNTTVVQRNTVVIDPFLHQGDMYKSNVWNAIPTLQLVTFKCVRGRDGKNLSSVTDWYRRETYKLTTGIK